MGIRLQLESQSKFTKKMTAYISTGSGLSSANISSAFVESVRLLNQAEAARNAANLGGTQKNNVTMAASFDLNVFSINMALPIADSLDASGRVIADVTDYLGSAYSAFVPGAGDAKSTDLPSLVMELAQKLSRYEKLVLPVTDQPNNVQIDISLETGVATITANIPFTPSVGTLGAVVLTAQDYV